MGGKEKKKNWLPSFFCNIGGLKWDSVKWDEMLGNGLMDTIQTCGCVYYGQSYVLGFHLILGRSR